MDLATKIKSPIQASRFEINWSTSKIRSPRASGRVLTYILQWAPLNLALKYMEEFGPIKETIQHGVPLSLASKYASETWFWDVWSYCLQLDV